MWGFCFIASIGCVALSVLLSVVMNQSKYAKKRKAVFFNTVMVGVFVAAFFMFIPIHSEAAGGTFLEGCRTFFLSVFNSMQVFTLGCEFDVVKEGMLYCPDSLYVAYQVLASVIFFIAPVFTFSFVLSLLKNISANLNYLSAFFKDVYIFSKLNEKSLALASDIKAKKKKAAVFFADEFEDNEESVYELIEGAKKIGAICLKKDILVIDFKKHSAKKSIYFFTISYNETNNLNQSLKLIENYRERENTYLYVFSKKIDSELLLTEIDKGKLKVHRVNEIKSLINRLLYEQGRGLFENAREMSDGTKRISAVVIGMGNHGTEMVKALTWYCQMDGYKIEVNAFDKDPLAEERFVALAPEFMSPKYNGVEVDGEAQYRITIHPGMDTESISFVNEINKINDATYVMVALGNDDINIKTAVDLRMYFERMKIHPVIQAIVYNSQQKKALAGIKNYSGQLYDIEFIGDIESSFTEKVIIDSELEAIALARHKKWGAEETFWTYEYNYRSSMALAIHVKAREECGIPGATKTEAELTDDERKIIETLEHRRWNAYMRAEGYVYSGSTEKSSRNDLAKMHNNLVDFSAISEEDKRKDSKVGTK